METPNRINYLNLRTAITLPAKEEKPTTVIQASDLIKVGGLYRIRDNYEAVWRMESSEDGKRYIVRADADGGETEAPERLRIAEDSDETHTPKAAHTVIAAGHNGKTIMECAAAGCTECREDVKDAHSPTKPSYEKKKLHEKDAAKKCPMGKHDMDGDKCNKCGYTLKQPDKNAYKVIHAGAVYVAWECADCATPNLTKFGSVYECDECHKHYADVLQKDEAAPQQTFTRAEVERKFGPEFGTRMARLGIRIAHVSLLEVWKREAEDDRCKQCRVPEHDTCPGKAGCPCCADSRREGAKAVNPWAVCHESVGPEKSDKFERCVQDVKKKSPIKRD